MPADIWDMIYLCGDPHPEKRPTIQSVIQSLNEIWAHYLPSLLKPFTPESLGSSQSGQTQQPFGLCYTAVVSSDLRLIGASASNGAVTLWDTEAGRTWLLQAEDDPSAEHAAGPARSTNIVSLALSPYNQYIAGGSESGDLYLWSFKVGSPVILEGHRDAIRAVAFSSDGRHIASGSDDFTIRIWDINSRKSQSISGGGGVLCLAFSPDGKFLASETETELDTNRNSIAVIGIWDLTELGKPVRKVSVGPSHPRNLVWSPSGSHLAIVFEDGQACIWNQLSGSSTQLEVPPTGAIVASFSPDGKYVVTGSGGNQPTIQVWEAKTGNLVAGPFSGHFRPVATVRFSPNGKYVISVCRAGRVRVWNMPNSIFIQKSLSDPTKISMHPTQIDSVGANTSQIPERQPSPLQYSIELFPLEEFGLSVPHHEPEPTHYSIELVEEDMSPIPTSSDNVDANTSQIPENLPSPLQYSIELFPLEEIESSAPYHEPEPTHYSIELIEDDIPPIPTAEPSPLSYSIELYPTGDLAPNAPPG